MTNTILLSTILSISSFLGINDADWKLRLQREVEVNKEPALLYRFERSDEQNTDLFGEHLSVVTTNDGTLKGFVKYTQGHQNQPLPTKEVAAAVSEAFLQQAAPDLLDNRKVLWIEPHDEVIQLQTHGAQPKKEFTVTGIKVKSLNTKTGLYFWTIVDANNQVFIFERDIKWITFPGKRGTEKWLHDSYLAETWGDLDD